MHYKVTSFGYPKKHIKKLGLKLIALQPPGRLPNQKEARRYYK